MENPTTVAAATTAATTAETIIHHTTAFLSKAIADPELRNHLLALLHGGGRTHFAARFAAGSNLLKPHSLALEAVEKAIAATNLSVQSSSLAVAEKLLLCCSTTPFSSFLLSLIYSLVHQPAKAARAVLCLFRINPSVARSKFAPDLFQELFLVHLLPALRWFEEQRTRILSNSEASPTKVLSRMNGGQTKELKELEGIYEQVLDENCRVFAEYFINEVLSDGSTAEVGPPPAVVLGRGEAGEFAIAGFGRYNPIPKEEDAASTSSELCSPFGSSSTSSTPNSSGHHPPPATSSPSSPAKEAVSPAPSISDSDDNTSSSSSTASTSSSVSTPPSSSLSTEKNKRVASVQPLPYPLTRSNKQTRSSMAGFDSLQLSTTNKPSPPPKDFVCPITSNIFTDPVTIETGQTYERKSIQEWLDRGNSTCPITRQKLTSTLLPKTNYVLKRLIAAWLEQNPTSSSPPIETPPRRRKSGEPTTTPSLSPNSVIVAAAAVDGSVSELRHAINNLCMSEILDESEAAVLTIERFWQEEVKKIKNQNRGGIDVQSVLARPAVVSGFVEILFNSDDPAVLRAAVFLLSELGARDESVVQTLTRVDSDVDCILALFKNGLMEAVVLIYHLLRGSSSPEELMEMDMVESLVAVLERKESEMAEMCMKPRSAAVVLLGRMMASGEGSAVEAAIVEGIVKKEGDDVVAAIVGSLESEWDEERVSAVGMLLKVMKEDGRCRNTVADKAELAPVLESFSGGGDGEKFEIICFLSELVKLNRTTYNEQVLHIIKDEGTFSTMHTFLNYLQTAPVDQSPVLAGLLLQLDLLAEPRKMSMYREEAIDTFISCLKNSELPAAQVAAAKTIMSLPGRFNVSGKSLTRAFLLKCAGVEKSYRILTQNEHQQTRELYGETAEIEERAAEVWDMKMASALVSHEFGAIFEVLAEGMKSRNSELQSACFVSAVWLVHMLGVLPDTGIRGAARVCLLDQFVTIFKSAKDNEDKVLALLALKSFLNDPEGLQDLNNNMKDVKKGLRELRKSCPLAVEVLKDLSEGKDNSAELWNHKELVQVDCCENGEVLSIACFKDKIISGHSDGTMKVWTGKGSILHLIQEIREHTKGVSSLVVLQSGSKLYSGSLDRTTRVWSIVGDTLHCMKVHDMKDPVHNLVVANSIACFIPAGTGIKVHSWSGRSNLLNSGRYVKCLSLVQGKLYCGCHDSSIQEIDLATETVSFIQSGSRKLISKASPVHALEVRDGLIYSAVSPLDGAAVKIWSASNHGQVGSLATTMEVRAMAVSSELIYLGSRVGTIEIWDRKKHIRVETIQACTNSKLISMAVDGNEDILVAGTSDGWIQAWEVS
ncbi:unnamed protein product [Linum tenue]|uniref:RING-type E3 ubiquitin transferase n=1 Tax=Linum tenue TaxID=586396 RepID=A0AAV0QEJ2_9ROSI|nr:unnamed protein product [Linum tenue]